MINAEAISEILSIYKKHGWRLRRVYLSKKLKNNLAPTESQFGDAEIVSAEIDAALFSRDSGKVNEAWELRHLSDAPFAIFELIEKQTGEKDLRAKLLDMEKRLENRLSKSK